LETSGGTATPELDFEPLVRQVTFAPSDTVQVIALGVMSDMIPEAQETIGLVLSQPSPGHAIGDPDSATVYLLDSTAPPRFAFADSTVSVIEAGIYLRLTVERSVIGDSASVTIATEDETAIAGQDYYSLQRRLGFGPQDTSRTVSVRIRSDGEMEDQETFRLVLRDPSDGYQIPDSSLTIVLHDDEPRAPTTPIHCPMEVGDRWYYELARWWSWDGGYGSGSSTREIWVHSEVQIGDHTLKMFRATPRDTVDAVYLAQEGQDFLFVEPSTLSDSSIAPTLPWRVASFLEGPGIVDTLFSTDDPDAYSQTVWTVENRGRSTVQVPAGIFFDVHVVSIAFRTDWRWTLGHYDEGSYTFYIADSVGLVRQAEYHSAYFGPGTRSSHGWSASLQTSSTHVRNR
jgi:hypothetical protein